MPGGIGATTGLNLLADVDLSQFKGEGGWQLDGGSWLNSRTDGAVALAYQRENAAV